jgi:hypothetical protein
MVSGSSLLGFLTGTKPRSVLSDQHPEEKPRLSTLMTLSIFLSFSDETRIFQAFFVFRVNNNKE